MTKISIIKLSSDLNNKELFPVSGSSSQRLWISSDIDTKEEENNGTDNPEIIDSDTLEILSFSVCKLWENRQLHINTGFSVTGWMLCVIPHICKDSKDHSESYNRNQFNNVIKTLFSGASEDEMSLTQDIFWTDYTDFDNKISSFDADAFIWKSKDVKDGHSHFWHQKHSLPCNKFISFIACRVTSKVLGIGAA